jgi:hypothetical protein
MDLWSQYYILDHGRRLGETFYYFKQQFFTKADWHGYKMVPRPTTKDEIIHRIADITFTLPSGAVKLTEKTENIIRVQLTPDEIETCRKFEREFFLDLEKEGIEITANNAASLANKLRQFASGFLYYEDEATGTRKTHFIHDHKYKVLQELDEKYPSIMVVCTYHEEFARLQAMWPDVMCIHGKTPKGKIRYMIRRWNEGRVKRLAIHPRSVGTGLNLQYGGCNQVWIGPDWSYLSKRQTIGRLHRRGQEKPVQIDIIVAEGTADEVVLDSVMKKEATAKDFAKSLDAYRKKVLTNM